MSDPGTRTDPAWHDSLCDDAKIAWLALDRMQLTLARMQRKTSDEVVAAFRVSFDEVADAAILLIIDELFPLTDEEAREEEMVEEAPA